MLRLIICLNRPLSRRLDRCDHVIQNEFRDPFGGNMYYVTMQITFLTRKFRNGERNLHCDVVYITTKWVSSLTLDCNGVFAIKAYGVIRIKPCSKVTLSHGVLHLAELQKDILPIRPNCFNVSLMPGVLHLAEGYPFHQTILQYQPIVWCVTLG